MKRFFETLLDDLPALVMLLLLLLIPTGALAVADWTEGLARLSMVVLVAVVASYLLAISRLPDPVILLFSVVYGLFFVWVMMASSLTQESFTFRQRMLEIIFRTSTWIEQALGGGFSRDNLMFILALAAGFWILSFNAVVNTFRHRFLWLATIPPGLVLLINNYYYFGKARMELFLIAYLFLAFMLAVRTNAVLREKMWRSQRVGYTPGVRFDLLRGGLFAVVVLIALAWSAPAASASNQLASAWDRSVNPWNRVQDTFTRLFSGLQGGTATGADYYGGATLSMGGPVNLGNDIVMYVYAPQGYHYYWRSKLFDVYQDGRWLSSAEDREQSDFGVLPQEEDVTYAMRVNIQERFDIVIPSTRLVYAAPEPLSFSSLPVNFDVIYTAPGKEYASVVIVRSTNLLTAGRSYGAVSSLSTADQSSLRAAGTNYPAWVMDRYLELPDTVTQRTRDLAASLAAPYDNPYDKARAIEKYLRENITYNQQVSAPPSGADPVDYLLFERREGYCTYYASAMVVMLRSLGIPARIAAGFAQGTYDANLNAYRVLESDAHTWVEAYFPSYGWIEFEPTSIIQPIVRPEARQSGGAGSRNPQEPGHIEGTIEPPVRLPDQDREQGANAAPGSQPGSLAQILSVIAWIVGAGVVIGLAGFGALTWFEHRGLLDLSEISRSYARLNLYAPLIGLALDPSATPYQRAERIVGALPGGEEPVRQITELYVGEQYGPPPDSPLHRDRENSLAHESWLAARRVIFKAWLAKMARLKSKR